MKKVCRECGKEFNWERSGPGRAPLYCSTQCKRRVNNRALNKKLAARYKQDEEFRRRKIESSVKACQKSRLNRKREAFDKLAQELSATNDPAAIVKLLDENVRLKAKLYDKPKNL